MCGILGVMAFGEFEDKKMEKTRQESMIFLATELLLLTQARGKDATGIAVQFNDCHYMGLKMGISAQEFVGRYGGSEKDFDGFINLWRKKTSPAKMVIGHCRKPSLATKAGPEDNKNNHPIKIADTIGVHNGTLTNSDVVFANLKSKRDGEVDSEAIFRLLNHFTKNGEDPFTVQAIQETCKRLHGSYSCLAFNGNNPYQTVLFRDSRPAEVAILRPLKLVVIASEKDYLKALLINYNRVATLYNTSKFIPLKGNDIEIGTLADDSLFIFDNRIDINSETKIDELHITEKIPRIGKLWAKVVQTAATIHANNNSAVVANTQTGKATVIQKPQTFVPPANIPSAREGLIWNAELQRYSRATDVVKPTIPVGNVLCDIEGGKVIDCDSGKVVFLEEKKALMNLPEETQHTIKPEVTSPPESETDSCNQKSQRFPFDKIDGKLDDLITDPAKIKVENIKVNNTTSSEEMDKLFDAIEVNTEVFPEILEKSTEAAKSDANYSNNLDLAQAMDMDNAAILSNMSLFGVANRLKKYIFQRAWYAGYVSCLKEAVKEDESKQSSTLKNLARRAVDKNKKAQNSVRVLKTIVKILGKSSIGGDKEKNLTEVISSVIKNESSISTEDLNVFREGDIRDFPELKEIISVIKKNSNK